MVCDGIRHATSRDEAQISIHGNLRRYITTSMSSLLFEKAPPEREPGYTISTFPKTVQEEFLRATAKKLASRAGPAARNPKTAFLRLRTAS